jgi:hypothetical protein
VATDDERWAIEQDRRALELLEVVDSDPIPQPLAQWSVSVDFCRQARELELPRARHRGDGRVIDVLNRPDIDKEFGPRFTCYQR